MLSLKAVEVIDYYLEMPKLVRITVLFELAFESRSLESAASEWRFATFKIVFYINSSKLLPSSNLLLYTLGAGL